MNIPRSPVVPDGPEYSRLSDSTVKGHWYAEGHSDPREEGDPRRESDEYRMEQERMREKMKEEEREKEEREKAEREKDEMTRHGVGKVNGSPPPFSEARIPSPKGSDKTSQVGSTEEPEHRATADESTPVVRNPASVIVTGARYVPVTTTDDDTAIRSRGSRSSRLSESIDWSQAVRCSQCFRFVLSPGCVLATVLAFAFALFVYMTSVQWLQPGLKSIITDTVTLRPETFSSGALRNTHIKLDIYFYNVTAINRTENGYIKIHTEELGPYTYNVKSSKTNLVWNKNSTVSYRVKQLFKFKSNHSNGSENDIINTVDASTLKILSKMRVKKSKQGYYVNSSVLPGGLARSQSVSEVLWGRKEMKTRKGLSDLLKKLYSGDGKEKSHRSLRKTNESLSPVYNVYTGKYYVERLDEVYTFNYSKVERLSSTKINQQNPLAGTADGDFFHPLLDKTYDLAMFYSPVQRNLLLQYQKSVMFKGCQAYRFMLPVKKDKHPARLTTSVTSLDVDDTHHEPEDTIIVSSLPGSVVNGLPTSLSDDFTMQYVNKDSPIKVTIPHCRHGSTRNDSSCKSYVDVHPVSGITLRKRLSHEMSLPIVYPGKDSHGHDLKVILPIMWVDWYYESVPNDMSGMMEAYRMLQSVKVAMLVSKIFLVTFAIVLMFQIFIYVVQRCCCGKGSQSYQPLEGRIQSN